MSDERRRRESALKIAAAVSSAGGTFTLTNVVLNSSGVPFLVSNQALNSSGTPYTIFR